MIPFLHVLVFFANTGPPGPPSPVPQFTRENRQVQCEPFPRNAVPTHWYCNSMDLFCPEEFFLLDSEYFFSLAGGTGADEFGAALAQRGLETSILDWFVLPRGMNTMPPNGIRTRAAVLEDPALITDGATYRYSVAVICQSLPPTPSP